MKLTCICPCWKRPQRNLRAMKSVAEQEFTGAETLFIGDKIAVTNYGDNTIRIFTLDELKSL